MRFPGLWLLFFVLRNGSLATTTRDVTVFRMLEGDTLSVTRISQKDEKWRMLCKNECGEQDILVQTSESRQTNGRYSIDVETKDSPRVDLITISNLTLSDSGRYQYHWFGSVQNGKSDFFVEVVGAEKKGEYNGDIVYAAAAGEDIAIPCVFKASGSQKTFCRNECAPEDNLVKTLGDESHNGRYRLNYTHQSEGFSFMFVTITDVSRSDSGLYQCRLDHRALKFRIDVVQDPRLFTLSLVLILICVVAVIITIIITASILTVCKNRASRGEPNLEHNYVNIPQSSSEREYQSLCLESMDTPYSSLHSPSTGHTD